MNSIIKDYEEELEIETDQDEVWCNAFGPSLLTLITTINTCTLPTGDNTSQLGTIQIYPFIS